MVGFFCISHIELFAVTHLLTELEGASYSLQISQFHNSMWWCYFWIGQSLLLFVLAPFNIINLESFLEH